jgi:hypothetical protein
MEEPIMKKLSMHGIIVGAALLTAMPLSQWSQKMWRYPLTLLMPE